MNDQNFNGNNIDRNDTVTSNVPNYGAPSGNPFSAAQDLPQRPDYRPYSSTDSASVSGTPSEQPVIRPQGEELPPTAAAVPESQAERGYSPVNGSPVSPAAKEPTEQTSASEPILEHTPGVNSSHGAYVPPRNPAGGYTPPPYTPPYTPQKLTSQEPPRYTSPERVYIGVHERKPDPEKKPKAKLSLGAAAILIVICVILSGSAAFGGTLLASRFIKTDPSSSLSSNSSPEPSVIFRDVEERNEEPGTYTQVAEVVSPTVVEIVTESLVADSFLWGSYVTSGAGSGVIVSSDGMIITNNHVVSGARNIRVRLSDGTEYDAKILGTDTDTDIAVIKIEAENLPFAILGNSNDIDVGEEVLAVGNPLGELGGTVTNGIVSAISRDVTIDGTEMTLIQTNAAVNPGNSGGGLFNLYGELIGIVNAKTTSSSSGVSVEGIGFAIPINTVSTVAEELVNHGYVRGKAMLGINYVDITSSYDAMMNRVSALGVYVTASEQPGLKAGDRIVAIDGEEVMYSSDIKSVLTGKAVGDVVEVTVVRNGKYVTESVTLLERKPTDTDESYSDEGYDDYGDNGYDDKDRDAFSDFFEESFRSWFS